MPNIPYKGFSAKEVERLLKNSQKISSFVGQRYVAKHDSVIREIQQQKLRQKQLSMYSGKTPLRQHRSGTHQSFG